VLCCPELGSVTSPYPVVEIDEQVWAERVANGHGPELDRSTLLIWESWTPDLGEMPPRIPTVHRRVRVDR
jgi:hypothetical protein